MSTRTTLGHRASRRFDSSANRLKVIAAAVGAVGFTGSLQAANISKTNDANALNQGTSWVGGAAPTSADIAVFDSTITGAIAPSLGDSAQSWQGIQVLSPGG